MITGTFDDDRADRTDDSPIQGAWEVEDESENGVKLVCRLSGRRGVEVDDLVAVRTGPARDWSVGTVHWAQADDSGDFALGMRLIRYPVCPVVIDPLQAEPDVSRPEPYMHLSAHAALRSTVTHRHSDIMIASGDGAASRSSK